MFIKLKEIRMHYHTGLVVKPSIQKLIEDMKKVKDIISFKEHEKFFVSDDETILTQITLSNAIDKFPKKDTDISCKEIMLNCSSDEEANNYLSIIKAGYYLASPETPHTSGIEYPIKVSKSSTVHIHIQEIWNQYLCDDNIGIALFVLNQALGNRDYIYSLEKYKISMELGHINAFACNPKYGQVFENSSQSYEEHTKMLMAIVAAYSIVEELGLEIRGSDKQKRFISKRPYEWNKRIWDDTLERLKQSNIDPGYKIQWTIRGEDTKIHKEMDYSWFGEEYENTQEVKDRKLHFIEAIQFSAYLRNFVAAHKFRDLASQISPYDVHNVQMTSRILLMQSMGIWDYVKRSN